MIDQATFHERFNVFNYKKQQSIYDIYIHNQGDYAITALNS